MLVSSEALSPPVGATSTGGSPLHPAADPARRRFPRNPRATLLALGTTLALLVLWEVLARAGVLSSEIPPFTKVLDWLRGRVTTGAFWASVAQTMWHWAAGLCIGVVVGAAIGALTGAVPVLYRLLQLPLEFLRPIPSIVYLPILILVFGATSKTTIICTAVGATWPMLFQTFYGVRAVDPLTLDTGRMFGLAPRQRLVSIMFPSVVPFMATGLRISASLALIVAVSIELIGGVPGLGADLSIYSQYGFYPGMYGIILVAGLIGVAINLVLERAERRFLSWHVAHRVVQS